MWHILITSDLISVECVIFRLLLLKQLPPFLVTSPQVSISPARLSVLEGDSAQFRCSASGFPAPVLQWHGGPGGRLPPEAVSSNGNGLLTFVKVKEIHEGEYFCTASNLGGISSARAFLNVSGKNFKLFNARYLKDRMQQVLLSNNCTMKRTTSQF